MEYTFLADQFEWLQEQKYPKTKDDWEPADSGEESNATSSKKVKNLNPLNS